MSEKGRGSVRGVVSAVGLFSSGRERELIIRVNMKETGTILNIGRLGRTFMNRNKVEWITIRVFVF